MLQTYRGIGCSKRTRKCRKGTKNYDGYSKEMGFYPVENGRSLKAFISMKRCNLIFVSESSLSYHWGK